ncbi:MAG: protoheme IX farnesyltransferase [Alphaproteobacteria bacterium]|nr:protoheme IX farnesyltransferase [Alphaproteobacteria bacterium]
MTSPVTAPCHPPLAAESSLRDYFILLKPGVMSLVVFTGLAGMLLAPVPLHPFLQAIAVLCIALGSGAGAALNMWYDRDIDAQMHRTAKRPIPAGRIAPDDALAFGLFLSLLAVSLMGLALNWIAAGLLAFAIFFYAVVYTMLLKRATPQNIVIGGAAGAFPPVIGWAAATGGISMHAVLLFLVIFLWTPPHFWALALHRNEDYRRAHIPMLPVTHGIAATTAQMLGYTCALAAISLLPALLGMQGALYAAGALALNACFLWHAFTVRRNPSGSHAMRMFGFSILYLFALFGLMLADRLLQYATGMHGVAA